MLAYKFTGTGGSSAFTGFRWPLPAGGAPGDWVRVGESADVCVAGVHACRAARVPHWLGRELWEVELGGDVVESAYKLVAPAGRLVRRVDGWPAAEQDFAADCARRTLELAVTRLRAAGLDGDADRLASAAGSDALRAIADRVADRTSPLVATLAGYAVDCEWDIEMGYYAMCAYVAATAFANVSTGGIVQDMSSDGWAQERARQATWLVDRLQLSDG